jgi:hypothetical protein
MTLHKLYGVTIESELALPAPVFENGPVDITVVWAPERPVPDDPPPGALLSQISAGVVNYSTTRTAGGYVIRFPGVCDAIVNDELTKVELAPASVEQRGLAELLFTGNVMANILTLGGHCVLHASAAAISERAIAFIGPPGRGKSTLAALACADGGRLITDDVLRLVPDDGGWTCPMGSGTVRLRPQAESIASLLNGAVGSTQDQRVGVALDRTEADVPLTALVFPLPSKEAPSLSVSRLTEQDSLMRLTAFPRVLGWRDPEVLAASFRWNARLAREVPAYEAILPWGPPFDPSIMSELVSRLYSSADDR